MQSELLNTANTRIGEHAVALYRGWNMLEKGLESRSDSAQVAVQARDFDLAPPPTLNPNTVPILILGRRELESRLEHLLRDGLRVEGGAVIKPDPLYLDGEFLQARFLGTLAYLKRLRGERMEPKDYIAWTMGEALREIPPQDVDVQSDHVAHLFTTATGISYNQEGYVQFLREHRLNPKDISVKFRDPKNRLIPPLEEIMGDDFKLKYRVIPVNEKVPWINWTSADGDGYVLKVNTHEQNAPRWFDGVCDMLVVHEVGGHLLQGQQIQRNIDEGLINPAYGITTVPGPEQWGSEGMAMTLPRLVPSLYRRLGWPGQLAVEYTILMEWVYHNAAVHVLGGGKVDDGLRTYIRHHLPGESNDRIDSMLESRTEDPCNMSYKASYAQGSHYFIRLANALNKLSADGGARLVYALNQRLMTPGQIKSYVEKEFDITEGDIDSTPTIKTPDDIKEPFPIPLFKGLGSIFRTLSTRRNPPQQSSRGYA